MPRNATATSIGSAMQLAYAYGGRAPVVLSDEDYAYQRRHRLPMPAYATSLVIASEQTYVVHRVRSGRVVKTPSVVIQLEGDARKDLF